ncbi:hypothetical protein KGF56_000676 [Candida oxycetoniae]|uniref:LSM complex subunit LSM4 n=1 Tax=Candida oxycetoniae TaxID=497107 RepID=A0AAI9T0W6_9ASCO|nr:uncharacterized protein KGF56_000676 [Candida oxycetoniae]KAI3406544.2 hypothetical protein KGF56_000676 [Candida oxycetoniae]
MLPLYLLTAAKNKAVLIELKTGETYNGNLTNCDSWMNLTLHDVVQTNSSGDKFEKISEIYIRGMHIKYLRIPDQIMDQVKEQQYMQQQQYQHQQGYSHGDRNRGNYGFRKNDGSAGKSGGGKDNRDRDGRHRDDRRGGRNRRGN